MSKSRARTFADIISGQENVPTTALGNVPPVTPTQVSDQANTSTGYLDLPSGTTAQRPSSANSGYTRYNTTTGSLEFYDGTNWIATNLIPNINSISGNIYSGIASTLTLSLNNATDTIDVKYYEAGTLLATDSGVTVTSGSATSTVPSAVYGQSAGDSISIQIFNQDGTPSSNSVSKTVTAAPSGGTITASGAYTIHTFNSSGTFTVPSGLSLSNVEYLVIAGGGGGAWGAGGAGGYRSSVVGENSGGGSSAESTMSLTSGSYTVTVGAGGAGQIAVLTSGNADSGTNSSFNSITSIGGGGGDDNQGPASSGGSGGGGGNTAGTGGSGTSGQGYAGANGSGTYGGGGGGGAGGAASSSESNPTGGVGVNSSITGTSVGRAGGGGGGARNDAGEGSASHGGGAGAQYWNVSATSGTANTGGGGGGGSYSDGNGSTSYGGNGGSGTVIIRYQLS